MSSSGIALPASAAATASSVARSQAARPRGRSVVETALAQVDDGVAGTEAEPWLTVGAGERPESLDHRIPSSVSSSTGSKNEQLPTATSCSRRTRASSSAPALRSPQRRASGVSEIWPSERVLVRERARGDDIQEAVPLVGCQRMVQAGRRLERNPRVAADSEEAPELRARRNLGTAAAHLRAQAALGQLGHPLLQLVVQRQFDVRLACQAFEAGLPARLDRLRPGIPAVGAVHENGKRPFLAVELVEPGGRPDEPRQQPRALVRTSPAILIERLRHRQARRRKERRVVDQVRERRAAGIRHGAESRSVCLRAAEDDRPAEAAQVARSGLVDAHRDPERRSALRAGPPGRSPAGRERSSACSGADA